MDDAAAVLGRYRKAVASAYAPVTALRRERCAERWLLWLAGRPLQEAQAEDCVAFLDALGAAPSVRKQVAAALRGLYRWGQGAGLWATSPWEGVQVTELRPAPWMTMTVQEAAALWNATSGRLFRDRLSRAVVALLYGAGLRVGEAVAAEIADVEISSGRMLVHRSKVGPHAACLVPPVASALEAWVQHARPLHARTGETALLVGRRGKRLSRRTVHDLVERAAAVAHPGSRVEPSRLRAAIADHLRAAGAPTRAVRVFLGDTSGRAPGPGGRAMSEEVRSAIRTAHPLVQTDAVGTAAP